MPKAKTRYVPLRMAEEDYKYIEEKAEILGKSVSETIRIMLHMWRYLMEQPLVAVIKSYSELKSDFGEDMEVLDGLRRSKIVYVAEIPESEEEKVDQQ